jgi:hypothetical protein
MALSHQDFAFCAQTLKSPSRNREGTRVQAPKGTPVCVRCSVADSARVFRSPGIGACWCVCIKRSRNSSGFSKHLLGTWTSSKCEAFHISAYLCCDCVRKSQGCTRLSSTFHSSVLVAFWGILGGYPLH